MTELFLNVVESARVGGLIILAILPLRFLLKKSPRWITCLLWGILALRLLLPYSLESDFSILPQRESFSAASSEDGETLYFYYQVPFRPVSTESKITVLNEDTMEQVENLKKKTKVEANIIFSYIWFAGSLCLFLYASGSFLHLKRKMRDSVPLFDNIRMSEKVSSPFVLGILKPKIYIPFHLDPFMQNAILSHEKAHIKRLDHLIKPFAFFLLTIYWFHPLIWLAFYLLCRDIEVACDEKVIGQMKEEERKNYAKALLKFGTNGFKISACPLAFGEENTKERIKRTMKYKKPMFWTLIFASVLILVATACLLTDPKSKEKTESGSDSNSTSAEEITPISPVRISAKFDTSEILYTSLKDANIYWGLACNTKKENAIPLIVVDNRNDMEKLLELSAEADDEWIKTKNNNALQSVYTDSFFESNSLMICFSGEKEGGAISGLSLSSPKSGPEIVLDFTKHTENNVEQSEHGLPLNCFKFKKNEATSYYNVEVNLKQASLYVSSYSGQYLPNQVLYTSIEDEEVYWALADNKKTSSALPMIHVKDQDSLQSLLDISKETDAQWILELNKKQIEDANYNEEFFRENSLLVFYCGSDEDGYIAGRSLEYTPLAAKFTLYYKQYPGKLTEVEDKKVKHLICFSLSKYETQDYTKITFDVIKSRSPINDGLIYDSQRANGDNVYLALYYNDLSDRPAIEQLGETYNAEFWVGENCYNLQFSEDENYIYLWDSQSKIQNGEELLWWDFHKRIVFEKNGDTLLLDAEHSTYLETIGFSDINATFQPRK